MTEKETCAWCGWQIDKIGDTWFYVDKAKTYRNEMPHKPMPWAKRPDWLPPPGE